MPQGKVSVSIVCYNNIGFLEGCLESLRGQSCPPAEVVLVDNASSDGSAEYVAEHFPEVRVIKLDNNIHFSGGHNIGIRNTSGEYVLVLNTDVVLEPDFLCEMVKAAEVDKTIGSVSGRIVRTGGKLMDTTGLFLGRDRRPLERGYGEPDTGGYAAPGFIFGAGGVSPLYRREMLESISECGEYFDEGFEAYYEDMDIAWRAHNAGWSAYYAPKAGASHARGGTNKISPPGLNFLRRYDFTYLSKEMKARLLANRYKAILKNDSLTDFLRDFPFIFLYDIKIWAYVVLFAPEVIPLFIRRLPGFKDSLRRRGIIQKKARCTPKT